MLVAALSTLTFLKPGRAWNIKLCRLLTDLQVQALTAMDGGNADIAGAIYLSPCPSHYAGHLATRLWLPASPYLPLPWGRMPSADYARDGVYEENTYVQDVR